jgi:hypothetical protein
MVVPERPNSLFCKGYAECCENPRRAAACELISYIKRSRQAAIGCASSCFFNVVSADSGRFLEFFWRDGVIGLSPQWKERFSIWDDADIKSCMREVRIMEKSIRASDFGSSRHLSDINPPPYFSTQSSTVARCSGSLPLSADGAQRRMR